MQNAGRKTLRQLMVGAGLVASMGVVGAGCGDEPTPVDPPVAQPGPNTENPEQTPTPEPVEGATAELDVALVRLNADGSLDESFDSDGIARVDFGPGYKGFQDSLWSLSVDAQNNIVLFGTRKGEGDRVDNDRVIARVTSSGALDTGFAENGLHILNMGNLSDNARHGFVQADDGKIVASGYVNQPTGVGSQSANRIVLVRLNSDGSPDDSFGVDGVVSSAPFVPALRDTEEWGMAEAYAVGRVGTDYVTTGYGRPGPTGKVDLVSFRYDSNGVRLTSGWGVDGLVSVDNIGQNDRGRNLVVVPGSGKTVMVGSVETQVTGSPSLDAMISIVNPDGTFDTSFDGDGRRDFAFERDDEAFFGVAANAEGTWVAASGYRAGKVGGVEEDDDSTLVLLPLSGTDSEVVKPVAISETANDRFDAVAFHGDKVYASGFVTEGGDNKMLVARFNLPDGSLDTTFGGTGFVTVNVGVGGTAERARGLAVDSDGKIIIGGVAEK